MIERDAYADLGTTTQEVMDITETSMDIIRTFVPDKTLDSRLRQGAAHSTGNIKLQHLIRYQNDPVVAGVRAIPDERPVVTDTTVAKTDIIGRGHNYQVRKAIGNGAESIAETGMTRTVAAMFELDRGDACDGAIAVVDNTSIAAPALYDYIKNGTRPTAIVATSVGSIKTEKSRKRARDIAGEYSVPAVTNTGKYDESGLAATLANELIHVASDARNDDVDLANHE